MSHRKVYSQGNIPFSWEDKPGVSKLTKQQDFQALELTPNSLPTKQQCSHLDHLSDIDQSSKMKHNIHNKIPLPPCPALPQPPRRSNLVKGLKWQLLFDDHSNHHEDPFLLAYIECTKPAKNSKSSQNQYKNKKAKKSMFMNFSCKTINSCDVIMNHTNNGNNFLKLDNDPKLPSLPSRYTLQNVVTDIW